jgi:HEAT repeat protein
VLSLTRTSDTLLVNGQRLDISEFPDFKGLATNFLKFLDEIGLTSLTFQKNISHSQLETFMEALLDVPDAGVDSNYLKEFAKAHGLSDILFDQNLYEARVGQRTEVKADGLIVLEQSSGVQKQQPEKPIPEELYDNFLARLPEQLDEFFFEGETAKIERLITLLFLGYQDRELTVRNNVIQVCQDLLTKLAVAYQHDLVKVLASPLLAEWVKEKEAETIAIMASLLNSLVEVLIQYVEYPLASKILTDLQNQYHKLKKIKDSHAQILVQNLDLQLKPNTQKLLVEDLTSSEPARQQNAALLLQSLGPKVSTLLINIITKEQDYRARQMAANLLQKQGLPAVKRLKGLLVLEISAEERIRILDIIDTLTTDCKNELFFALGDEATNVREAAYRLAERLNDDQIVEWLLEFARSKQSILAIGAIKCLAKISPSQVVVEEFITLLNSSKDESVLVACCRALGQIARPTSIEALAKALETKRFLFFHRGNSAQVRTTAAFALAQIPHSKATHHLAQLVNDRDPRIRQIAQNSVQSVQSS